MLAARLAPIEYAEFGLLAIGLLVSLIVVVQVCRRVPWSDALRLAELPPARFTLVDILAYVLVTNLAAGVCARLVGGGRHSAETPPTTRTADQTLNARQRAVVSLLAPTSGAAFLIIVSRYRVRDGLKAWGLSLDGLRRAVLPALWRYLAVWPFCAGLLFLTRAIVLKVFPDHPLDEHVTLALLRGARDGPAWVPVLLVAGAVVAAPLAEELFFRGAIQSLVAGATRSPWAGVFASALIFGAVHAQNPETIPPLFLFGVALSVAFARTRSLAVPVLMHVLFNARTIIWLALGAEP